MSEYECKIDILKALDWQRSNAESFIALAKSKQKWYEDNHCAFWNSWAKDVFDLDTANEFGLSVWSRILDVPLFGENLPSDLPIELTLEQKRIMLKLKAFICSMSGSTKEINQKLKDIFGETRLVVVDGFDMTCRYYVFGEDLRGFAQTLVKYKLLPAPNSVQTSLIIDPTDTPFAFEGFPNAYGLNEGLWAEVIL